MAGGWEPPSHPVRRWLGRPQDERVQAGAV